jgi:hypothetical protein
MPGLQASMAVPALRAYAQVLSNGTTPTLNSGVSVERLGTGDYMITLPVNLGVLDGHELVFIQIKADNVQNAISSQYLVSDSRHIEVLIWEAVPSGESNTLVDSAFNFFLFATTVPTEVIE